MDHIPRPVALHREPPEIPYVCAEPYDGGDFHTYPERQGWTKDSLLHGPPENRHRVEQFMQQWLYFGLLHAFFGDLYKGSDFVRDGATGTKIVHTNNLISVAQAFQEKDKENGGEFEKNIDAYEACIIEAYRWSDEIEDYIPGFDTNLWLSLVVLQSYLRHIRNVLVPGDDVRSVLDLIAWLSPRAHIPGAQYDACRFRDGSIYVLDTWMLDGGWCPSQITRFTKGSFIESRLYMACMKSPSSPADHANCSSIRCQSSQADRETYVSVHVEDDCSCEFLGVDPTELTKMLESGGNPVVMPILPSDELTYVPLADASKEGMRYVSISHVWSHGLGNPRGNAMPRCQLNRISQYVTKQSGNVPTPFWIDTICCPSAPPTAKKTSIAHMPDIYKNSFMVLVIDLDLLGVSIENKSVPEMAFLIMASKWLGRLWTLQEGVFAQKLCIQLQDDIAVDVDKMNTIAKSEEYKLIPYSPLTQTVALIRNLIRGERRSEGSYYNSIALLAEALGTRATSVATDEPICLSSLLGIPIAPLLEVDPEERMVKFWSLANNIPRNCIFWPHARLTTPGFRWAPKSFLGNDDGGHPVSNVYGNKQPTTLTSRGLQTKTFGIKFRKTKDIPLIPYFCIMNEELEWTHLVSIKPSKEEVANPTFDIPEGMEDKQLALVVAAKRDNDSASSTTYAVYVYIEEEKDGVIYARRCRKSGLLYLLSHRACSKTMQEIYQTVKDKSEPEEGGGNGMIRTGKNCYSALVGEWTSGDQEWCID